MPVYPFNNVVTADAYADAATCQFPRPVTSFSMQVYSASVYYTLLFVPRDGLQSNAYQPDTFEHFLGPTLSSFDESDLPLHQAFAGIKLRSGAAGVPARVTVI